MLGLTPLGIVHTAFSLVAVAAGIAAFVRDGRIVPGNGRGRTYLVTTLVTAVTGLGWDGSPEQMAFPNIGVPVYGATSSMPALPVVVVVETHNHAVLGCFLHRLLVGREVGG